MKTRMKASWKPFLCTLMFTVFFAFCIIPASFADGEWNHAWREQHFPPTSQGQDMMMSEPSCDSGPPPTDFDEKVFISDGEYQYYLEFIRSLPPDPAIAIPEPWAERHFPPPIEPSSGSGPPTNDLDGERLPGLADFGSLVDHLRRKHGEFSGDPYIPGEEMTWMGSPGNADLTWMSSASWETPEPWYLVQP